jgi:hypothetical protein
MGPDPGTFVPDRLGRAGNAGEGRATGKGISTAIPSAELIEECSGVLTIALSLARPLLPGQIRGYRAAIGLKPRLVQEYCILRRPHPKQHSQGCANAPLD